MPRKSLSFRSWFLRDGDRVPVRGTCSRRVPASLESPPEGGEVLTLDHDDLSDKEMDQVYENMEGEEDYPEERDEEPWDERREP